MVIGNKINLTKNSQLWDKKIQKENASSYKLIYITQLKISRTVFLTLKIMNF